MVGMLIVPFNSSTPDKEETTSFWRETKKELKQNIVSTILSHEVAIRTCYGSYTFGISGRFPFTEILRKFRNMLFLVRSTELGTCEKVVPFSRWKLFPMELGVPFMSYKVSIYKVLPVLGRSRPYLR